MVSTTQYIWSSPLNGIWTHNPEERNFKASHAVSLSLYYFFGSQNGCLVYDDEFIGSKTSILEVKSSSYGKAALEGSTVDCIFDLC